MTTETHYVANIKVERVDLINPPVDGRRPSLAPAGGEPKPTRRVGEVTQLVIKAPTMEALKTKVAAHISLIEDDVPMDEVRRPGTR